MTKHYDYIAIGGGRGGVAPPPGRLGCEQKHTCPADQSKSSAKKSLSIRFIS